MVKNQSSNAGDVGSIPGQRTKIPHAVGVTKPTGCNEKISHAATKIPCATNKT